MKPLFFFLFSLLSTQGFAQVAIATTGSMPHSSAMLDVRNPNKGFLLPRVTLMGTGDVSTVPAAATSLLVYNTAEAGSGATAVMPGFYYWNGSAWTQLATGPISSSAWIPTGNAGTVDSTNFIGTIDNVPFNIRVNNQKAGRIESNAATANTFWGYQAGNVNSTGTSNTATGYQALNINTTGYGNTANGAYALKLNTTGYVNTANGLVALNSNTTGYNNTASGFAALFSNTSGYSNTAGGLTALYANTTGSNNAAFGSRALQMNTTGFNNVAVGVSALYSNTTSSNLVAIGDSALYNNIEGYNTAVGSKALYTNTTGVSNTANGFQSLYANTEGSYNTTSGYKSLLRNTNGSHNTASGNLALRSNTTGYNNTAFGSLALASNDLGIGNTALGYGADVGSGLGSLTNATAIGYNAKVTASNKVRIGNTNVTAIEGEVAYSFPSDARFKYNIQNNVPGLDFIQRLQPVTYYFDQEKLAEYNTTGVINNSVIRQASHQADKQLHTGFLAQDVERIAKELGYSFDGLHAPANNKDHYSLAYSQFIMPLVKAVQEQQVTIESQQKQIDGLKKLVTEMLKGKK